MWQSRYPSNSPRLSQKLMLNQYIHSPYQNPCRKYLLSQFCHFVLAVQLNLVLLQKIQGWKECHLFLLQEILFSPSVLQGVELARCVHYCSPLSTQVVPAHKAFLHEDSLALSPSTLCCQPQLDSFHFHFLQFSLQSQSYMARSGQLPSGHLELDECCVTCVNPKQLLLS